MSAPHLLAIENVTAHYGAAQALFGVNLTIDAGQTVALVGANGAGKTTLLKCIMGLMRASNGRVLLDGRHVTGASPAKMVRNGLGPDARRTRSLSRSECGRKSGAGRGGPESRPPGSCPAHGGGV